MDRSGLIPQSLQLRKRVTLESIADVITQERAPIRVRIVQSISEIRAVQVSVFCSRSRCKNVTEVGELKVLTVELKFIIQNDRDFVDITLT